MDSAGQAGAAPAVSPGSPEIPLAVVPFVYQRRGIFSIDRCTLVVYTGQVVIAYVSKASEDEFDQATTEVEALLEKKHLEGKDLWQLAASAGFSLFRPSWSPVDFTTGEHVREQKMLRNISIPTRPWERYLSMAPAAVLAEDGRNKSMPRASISYIRGESDPDTSTEQVLIYSSAGLTQLYFNYGIYFLARAVLFSFLFPGRGVHENPKGVVPFAGEPQVKGFGFQYSWNIVVTDQRFIFCMIEDDLADEVTEWTERVKKDARKAGRTLRDEDLTTLPDAPWHKLMNEPVTALLENDVNFFIPLSAIQSIKIVTGSNGQAEELWFSLHGEPYHVGFHGESASYIRQLLEKVLPGRVSG
jgi:hypothetical protein